MLNQVELIGRLGKDPEIRSTQGGAKCANFSLATSERWNDRRSGEKKEKTEWHNVVVWNEGLVSVIERFVKKGSQIYVRGSLETRKWKDRDGQDRWSTEVVLKFDGKVILLGARDDNGGGGERRGGRDDSDRRGSWDDRESRGQSSGSWNDRDGGGSKQPYDDELDDDVPF